MGYAHSVLVAKSAVAKPESQKIKN